MEPTTAAMCLREEMNPVEKKVNKTALKLRIWGHDLFEKQGPSTGRHLEELLPRTGPTALMRATIVGTLADSTAVLG